MEVTASQISLVAQVLPGDFAIFVCEDGPFRLIGRSRSLPAVLGMAGEELDSRASEDATLIVSPVDRKLFSDALAQVSDPSGASSASLVFRVGNSHGDLEWLHANARAMGEMDSRPVVMVTLSNATSETREFAELLDHSNGVVYVIDRGTHEMLYANDYALALWGRSGYQGRICHRFVYDRESPCPWCSIPHMTGDSLHVSEIRDPTTGKWFRIDCRRMQWHDHDAVAVYVIEISDQKRHQEEIEATQRMYAAAVGQANLAVWEYDVTRCRVVMSDADSSRSSYSRLGLSKVIENVPESLVPLIEERDVPAFREMYRKVAAGEPEASCEVWFKPSPNREPICEHISYTVVIDGEGKPTMAYGISQDVTARKNAEERYGRLDRGFVTLGSSAIHMLRLNLTADGCQDGPDVAGLGAGEHISASTALSALSSMIDADGGEAPDGDVFSRDALLERFRLGDSLVSLDYPIVLDGSRRWHRGVVTMVQNPTTGDVEALLSVHDITEAKLEEMVASCITEQGYDLVGVIDVTRGTLKVVRNSIWPLDEGQRHVEMAYDECERIITEKHLAPADRDAFAAGFDLSGILPALEAGGPVERSYRCEDAGFSEGLRKQVLLSWLDRRHGLVLITQTDVTSTYQQEQEHIRNLELAQRSFQSVNVLLQSILDTTPVAIFWKDADRRFEGANKAFLDFYGFPGLSSIIGRNDEDMGWHPDADPYKNDELRVIHERERTHRVPGICLVHGVPRHIVASKSPRIEGGEVVGLVGSFEDVTDEFERNAEIARLNVDLRRALDEAERANASEQAFLSSVSHDIRTPLSGVLGFADLALNTDDPVRKQDYLRKINVSGRLMLDLVNDVLDMSKIESGKMELRPQAFATQDLFEGIVDSVRLSAQRRDISLLAEMEPDYPRFILADRLRLQQIVLNLLSNAIKYTPDGGVVSFDVRWLGADERYNTLVCIKDTGIGMSKEFQKRMFEPFAQEHQSRVYAVPGTGLGLAIVKRIVDLMGGTIEVESDLGRGSTFSVRLPMEEVDIAGATAKASPAVAANLTGRRFLLVEDNDLNAEIAETILRERVGAEVDRAENGRIGLEAFEHSEPGSYSAILMDLRMPVMSGIEATEAIRALGRPDAKTIPIVAMSADAFAEDVQRCVDAGMNDHIPKPIDPGRLISVLAGLCGGKA